MTSGHNRFSRVLLVFLWTAVIGGEFNDLVVFVREYFKVVVNGSDRMAILLFSIFAN